MTPSEMLTLLGYRLEDPYGDKYDATLKTLMINRAQLRVITELNGQVVPELLYVESDIALTSGAFAVGDLTFTPLGGISGGVKNVKLAGYDFTTLISFEEYKRSVNRSITYTTSNPKRYLLNGLFYILPSTYDVDVYYVREPTKITLTGSTPVQAAFDYNSEMVHDAVAFYAESLLWGVNNDPRKAQALQEASSLINTLNTTITATDSNDLTDEDVMQYTADYILPTSAWEV